MEVQPIKLRKPTDGTENIGGMTSITDEKGTRYYKVVSVRKCRRRTIKGLKGSKLFFCPVYPDGYYVKEYEFVLMRSEIMAIDNAENDKACMIQDVYELKEMDKKAFYLKTEVPQGAISEGVPIEKRIKIVDRIQ